MEQRVTMVTLGVADMAAARKFYCDGLGWRESAASNESVAFIEAGGVVLGLYGWSPLAEDAGVSDDGTGFRGVALAHNVASEADVDRVLDEAERILKPHGKALFIVPNRGGIWARRDKTPFGFGRPFSLGQLEAQLKRNGFLPERHLAALYQPPSDQRFWLKTGGFWERAGRHVPFGFAGGDTFSCRAN